jgi:hypothetical protein
MPRIVCYHSSVMTTLPNIHDHSLLEYRVDLANRRITLITLPESARLLPNVPPVKAVFEGREGHHFNRVSTGVIFLDIEEAPLVEFLKAHEVELDEGFKSVGAPSWWGGSIEKARAYLISGKCPRLRDQFVLRILRLGVSHASSTGVMGTINQIPHSR